MTNFSSRILAYRKIHSLTQEQLALQIGVSSAAISKWETQNVIPDIDVLISIADLFETTLDDLLGRTTNHLFIQNTLQEQMDIAREILHLSVLSRQEGLLAIDSYVVSGDQMK